MKKVKNYISASTTERVLAASAILAGFVGAFVLWFFNPSTAGFFPTCPLHTATGLNCPGCGMTRGFHALLHGDILAALQFNLLLPIFALFFGYVFVSILLTAARGRGLSFKIFTPTAVYTFLIASLIFGILRNLPFYPFSIFSL